MSRSEAGYAIAARMRELGVSQVALARSVGRRQPWVSQYLLYETEDTIRRLWLDSQDLVEKLLKRLEWTDTQFEQATGIRMPYRKTNEPLVPHSRDGATRAELVPIPFRGVASAGTAPDADAIIEIPRKFARPRCAMYVVEGESMLPNFEEGDTLLVDESLTIPRNNGVFAIRIPGNGVQIRRCWILKSFDRTVFGPDNQEGQFPSYDWQDDDIEIMGQVYSKLSAAPV